MPVAALKSAVVDQIRNGQSVTSLIEVADELIVNSIDGERALSCSLITYGLIAGARRIGIHVNMATFTIKVVDDGEGISADDLQVVGQRHTTSKINTIADIYCDEFQ